MEIYIKKGVVLLRMLMSYSKISPSSLYLPRPAATLPTASGQALQRGIRCEPGIFSHQHLM